MKPNKTERNNAAKEEAKKTPNQEFVEDLAHILAEGMSEIYQQKQQGQYKPACVPNKVDIGPCNDKRGLSKDALRSEADDRKIICPIYFYDNEARRVTPAHETIYTDLNNIAFDMQDNYINDSRSTVQGLVYNNLAYSIINNIKSTYATLIYQNILSSTEFYLRSTGIFGADNYTTTDGMMGILAEDMQKSGLYFKITNDVYDVIQTYMRSEAENRSRGISNEPDWSLLEYQMRITTYDILTEAANVIVASFSKSVYVNVTCDADGIKPMGIAALMSVVNIIMNNTYPLVFSSLHDVRASLIQSDIQGISKETKNMFGPFSYDKNDDPDFE